MGISEDMCTFKVPLNYVLAGGSYGEDGKEKTIAGLNSATTTVEDALAAGSFSTGEHLAFFTMTSLDDDHHAYGISWNIRSDGVGRLQNHVSGCKRDW